MFRISMRQHTAFCLTVLTLLLVSPTRFVELANGQESGQPDVLFSLQPTSRLGVHTYVPGEWGEFNIRVENRESESRELLCTSYFDGLPALQFGRRVWLPGRSRLTIAHPVLFPTAERFPENRAEIRTLVYAESNGREIPVKSGSGQVLHNRSLLVSTDSRNTGVIAGWDAADQVPEDVLDLVVASRIYQGLDNKLTYLAGQFLPADSTSLKYLDHLILADDRLADDLAALAAVRRWLHAGGRLWIMLDRADPLVLERLFGDEFQGAVVDRVGLTSVRLDQPPSVFVPDGTVGESVDYEVPVEMVRMAESGMHVWNTVNGWPAALTRTYGEGRVLITTLGPRGWIQPSPPTPNDAQPAVPANMRSDFVPKSSMEDIAPWILAERTTETLPAETLESFAQEYISYDVPTWRLVIGSMAGFLVLLVVTGSVLWRWGRLEHFGWIGSLLAIGFGMLFLRIGVSNRSGTPDTLAEIQVAQAITGTDDVRTHGAVAVYRREGGESPVFTSLGGEFRADLTGAEGQTVRMEATDLGTFRWQNLSQSPGMEMYTVSMADAYSDRMSVKATLDAQGVTGKYSDQLKSGSDAVIVARRGRIGVRMSGDGDFVATADDVLEPDQFLDAMVLDDVQDRRRRILQQLFNNHSWQNSLDEPRLMLWLDDWENGFEFGSGLQAQADQLLIVPVEFMRPPAGTEVLVPAPLVSYRTRLPPDGSPAAGFWDDARQEWQERSRPSTTWLDVQVPSAFLPLQATDARVVIGVSGLMGQIDVLGVKDGSIVTIETVADPVGSIVVDVTDPEILSISESGQLTLGVSAGVQQKTETAADNSGANTPDNYWQIDSLSVQLRGTIAEQNLLTRTEE